MNHRLKSHWVRVVAALSMAIGTPMVSHAQTPPTPNFDPPTVSMVDVVGVSMNSGRPSFSISPVKIGPEKDPLRFSQSFSGGMNYQSSLAFGSVEGSHFGSPFGIGDMVVSVLGQSEQMQPTGDGIHFTSRSGRGGTLTISSTFTYQYVDRNGAVYDFINGRDPSTCADHAVWSADHTSYYEAKTQGYCAILSKATYPSGVSLTVGPYLSVPGDTSRAVQKITRSDGYQLVIEWQLSTFHFTQTGTRPPNYYLNSVTAYNMAVDYCAATATSCSYSTAWPSASMVRTAATVNPGDRMTFTLTDSAGTQTRYTEQMFLGMTSDWLTHEMNMYQMLVGIKPPSSATADTVTYSYANNPFCWTHTSNSGYPPTVQTDCNVYARDTLVQTVTTPSGVWQYSYTHDVPDSPVQSMAPGLYTTTVTRPDQYTMSGQFNSLSGGIQWVQGTQGSLNYASTLYPTYLTVPNYVTTSTDAEGRYFQYQYDSRGNLLSKRQGSASTDPVTTAVYPATCVNAVTCNKPTQLIDANGNTTDYTYDPTHGAVLTETAPADPSGVRPQKRYAYVQRTPWIKNASGGYSAGTPIWKLSTESHCRTSAAAATGGCTVAGDEVVTSYDYGPNSGPNNLLLRGVVVTADGVSHRTCYAYDAKGNKLSDTTPGAGLATCP